MTPETTPKSTKLCPTCGTRISEQSTRCVVCGTDLTIGEKTSRATKAIQGSRMPEITLNLPAALGLLTLFLLIGAGMVFFGLRETGRVVEPTLTPTVTLTSTPTITPTPVTPTPTNTPLPTPTPLSYEVKIGDNCAGIAFNFGISIQSIVLMNNLSADCALFEGQKLLIPQPTPTATPLPTSTLSPAEATEQACQKDTYIVQENDTLSSISQRYDIPMAVIKEYNGLTSDIVFSGMPLTIPLCKRFPTPGPSPTATPLPPFPAPNLLLPIDGASFTSIEDIITLQWAAVGTLADNEAYLVVIVDITAAEDRKLMEYVTDTKFIVPENFQPTTTSPHAFRWWVTTVRQTGTDEEGKPIWEPAGATSVQRVFIWSGAIPPLTPTP